MSFLKTLILSLLTGNTTDPDAGPFIDPNG